MEKSNYTVQEVFSARIESIWDVYYTNPLLACEQITEVVAEIRQKKDKSTHHTLRTLIILELSALHLLSFSFFKSNNLEKTKFYAEELFHIAQLSDNEEYCALAEHILAKIEIKVGNWDNALHYLKKALLTLQGKNNYKYVQAIFIDFSTIEAIKNNYEMCLEYLLQAESSYQAHPVDPKIEITIMSNIADVYMRLGNYVKAIEYNDVCLRESNRTDRLGLYAIALLRLSNIYAKQGKSLEQIDILKESIDILLKFDDHHRIAVHSIALGEAYLNVQNFEYSLIEFQNALPLLEQKNDKKNMAILHHRLGLLYSHQLFEYKNVDIAQNHLDMAEQIAIELSMPHFQAAVVESRARAFAAFGLFEKGFEELDRANSLEKQVLNEKSLRQIHDLEVRYEMTLKEKEIQLLDADKKVLELERTQLQAQLSMNNQYLFMYKKELNDFKTEILSITKQLDKAEIIVHKVKTKLRESLGVQDRWESYMEIFTKVHPQFKEKLITKYPNLTEMEVRVCVLIRAGLISTEIAEILSLSYRTIENKRLIIRHKLELKDKEKLDAFLSDI